jgi:hypothetical protein
MIKVDSHKQKNEGKKSIQNLDEKVNNLDENFNKDSVKETKRNFGD